MEFHFFSKFGDAVTALKKGRVDLIPDHIGEEHLSTGESAGQIRHYRADSLIYEHLDFNLRHPILRDVQFVERFFMLSIENLCTKFACRFGHPSQCSFSPNGPEFRGTQDAIL